MRLLWSERAEDDVAAIVEYVANDNPRAAVRVGDEIDQQIQRLREFPEMGRRGRVRGTREPIIAGLPYIAVYRALPEVVQIVRVLHGAQQWPPSPKSRRDRYTD